ncbi:helix-turn-helix transcriptional regulator [Micromonospora sp. WMMD1082]|uniref:helix-turn-helix domain-containing protein n=1 Tax=Micromonospora sp. WMMD1082 TaxID=3016104 RepID=UPI002416E8AF|nr:helix-turn-helix transcriptional regulator [Micromonospora sp. WMMD1082]MDG4797382.1 helix-turn-helix transcriptional regulator [Micromonospora sp. WMMD1082]
MTRPTRPTGQILAEHRQRASLTQEQLAERAGVSVETIRKLEQGVRRSARMDTLHALARALGLPTSALVGDQAEGAARAEPDHRPLSLAEIRRAVAPIRGLGGTTLAAPPGEPPAHDVLRARLHAADRAYQANDYATALSALPPLLLDVRAASGLAADTARPAAYVLLARTLHLTGNLLIQLRAGDLAQTALSDALAAAEAAGDQVVAATVVQGMTWLLMRQGRLAEAAELAVATADQVEPRFSRAAPAELAAWGWLAMGAAAAYARDNQPDMAAELVDAAGAAAVRIGERAPAADHLMMVGGFDAARVQMQRVENAAVAGDPGRALDLARAVPPGPTPVRSSWQRHRLDVAWAHAEQHQYADATGVLLELQDRAPAWLRHQRYARDIVRQIAEGRRRAMSSELAELAALVGCTP